MNYEPTHRDHPSGAVAEEALERRTEPSTVVRRILVYPCACGSWHYEIERRRAPIDGPDIPEFEEDRWVVQVPGHTGTHFDSADKAEAAGRKRLAHLSQPTLYLEVPQ
jgi:hypothetical protein